MNDLNENTVHPSQHSLPLVVDPFAFDFAADTIRFMRPLGGQFVTIHGDNLDNSHSSSDSNSHSSGSGSSSSSSLSSNSDSKSDSDSDYIFSSTDEDSDESEENELEDEEATTVIRNSMYRYQPENLHMQFQERILDIRNLNRVVTFNTFVRLCQGLDEYALLEAMFAGIVVEDEDNLLVAVKLSNSRQ
ncbi:hypothetical protein BDB00DRAFT_792602 [Zychaea mexicana]|uniref:uncharacterized protein n=1 Tax=Zychaea mexicana TaxID=64656 RepID=UPI0022FEC830|nr:uncharacterized protein BDB00DRAFT_792602 [Zychaea mexicana]KAI9484782.1 hypothetical protein BDB00DRAFT_792602 [Zychaea mexicana]